MAGLGLKGDIIRIPFTFYDRLNPADMDEGIEVLLDAMVVDEDGKHFVAIPAPGHNFPEHASRPKKSDSPPAWSGIRAFFLEPLLSEIRPFTKLLENRNEEVIDSHLEDLENTLLPIAMGKGSPRAVDAWQRVEIWLGIHAAGILPLFKQRVADLLEHVRRAINEDGAQKGSRMQFLGILAEEFCVYLENLRGWLPPDSVEGTTGLECQTDGPCDPFAWRKDGQKVKFEFQPKTWKLLNHLWRSTDKTAEFEDLAEPVFEDREEFIDKGKVGKQRTLANYFFKRFKLPWRVSIKGSRVFLVRQ